MEHIISDLIGALNVQSRVNLNVSGAKHNTLQSVIHEFSIVRPPTKIRQLGNAGHASVIIFDLSCTWIVGGDLNL